MTYHGIQNGPECVLHVKYGNIHEGEGAICMRASLCSTNRTLILSNVSVLHMQNTFWPVLDSAVSHSFRYPIYQPLHSGRI